jgi:hypothetical protein
MTETIAVVAVDQEEPEVAATPPVPVDQDQVAEQLLAQAKAQGVELVGPNGLLNQLTKRVLETALEEEMSAHLGYQKHDPLGRDRGNSRNGTRAKTVLTEIGPVEIEVPRDTDASFQPQIVKKRQRRLTGVDEIVLSLTARGLTTGEIAAHNARGLRRLDLQRHGLQDHRQGGRGDDRVVQPAARSGVSGHLHRRHRGQSP